MTSRTNFFWSEIAMQHYNFDRNAQEAAFLGGISKEELQKFYQDYICLEAPYRRKLATYVVSTAEGGAGANGISPDLPDAPIVIKIPNCYLR
jgi:secreted Zn-dependent insulinase-like peptidase